MKDVKIKTDEGSFKYRVSGIFIRNNKILLQNIEGNDFYCLPGGHVEMGESASHAVKRELEEELNFSISVNRPVFIIENFFVSNRTNTKMHELCWYFLIDSDFAPKSNWSYIENDKGVLKKLEYIWVDFNELKNIFVKPKIIKDKLLDLPNTLQYFVFED